jgi:hypothetical protein
MWPQDFGSETQQVGTAPGIGRQVPVALLAHQSQLDQTMLPLTMADLAIVFLTQPLLLSVASSQTLLILATSTWQPTV